MTRNSALSGERELRRPMFSVLFQLLRNRPRFNFVIVLTRRNKAKRKTTTVSLDSWAKYKIIF